MSAATGVAQGDIDAFVARNTGRRRVALQVATAFGFSGVGGLGGAIGGIVHP